jgi:RNA polymerase sigma factor (sigma-70 family)
VIQDKTITEDILQDAFVKIWKNIDNYDSSKGRLYTWLRKLTHNLTLDYLKSKHHKTNQKVVATEEVVTAIPVANTVIGRLDANDFKQKLNKLDAKQRQILDLSYYQGYTQEEIAVALDMPIGTVKTRIRNAIIELRKIFT